MKAKPLPCRKMHGSGWVKVASSTLKLGCVVEVKWPTTNHIMCVVWVGESGLVKILSKQVAILVGEIF